MEPNCLSVIHNIPTCPRGGNDFLTLLGASSSRPRVKFDNYLFVFQAKISRIAEKEGTVKYPMVINGFVFTFCMS